MNLKNTSKYTSKETFYTITENNAFFSVLTLIKACLVLISRAGFVLIQFGSVPTESFYDLLLQNVVEFSVSLASYGLLGALLSFGNYSYKGIIGYGGPWSQSTLDLDNITLGFCTVITGSAIITTFLSSRLHFLGCALLAFIYGGFFQPLVMHWMWHKDGWMNNVIIGNVTMEMDDHGGGVVIHVTSSCVGLMGVIFLGRRLLRLNYIDDCSLGAETPSTILVGYIFIALGLIGLSLSTSSYNHIGVALINDFLSLAGGSLSAILSEFVFYKNAFNYWVLLRCIQGSLSALIVMSSSVDVSIPSLSFGVTLVLTTFLNICSKFIYRSSLEDYCNVLTVHLQAGIWASFLQPFLNFHRVTFNQILIKFSWHVICTVMVICSTLLFFSCAFLVLSCTGFLRNKIEDNCHRRSNKLARSFKVQTLRRFFLLNDLDMILEPGISGKIPENPSPDYLENSSGKAATFVVQNNTAIVHEPLKENGPSKNERKTKNIYTIKKVPLSHQTDAILSSGDTAIHKLEDLIKQKTKTLNEGRANTKMRNNVAKRKSHLTLNNKSRCFSDLRKNRHVKKTLNNKSKICKSVPTFPIG